MNENIEYIIDQVIELFEKYPHKMRQIRKTYELNNEIDELKYIAQYIEVLNWRQLFQIRMAIKNNVRYNRIDKFAKPIFTWQQMEKLRIANENHINEDNIILIANPNFTPHQMEQITLGFTNGLSEGEVKKYANEIFNDVEMEIKRVKLEKQRKERIRKNNY